MASRMDRYYKGEERSKKNQSLYEQINALGTYTNIEGVVDISNSNEIDINNIKELIGKNNHHEEKPVHINTEEIIEEDLKEEKNYDLRDLLSKAKTNHSDSDVKHRNLKKRQYQVLKKLHEENPENEEIDKLLNTLALGNSISDDLGLFDDLKSDTMVGTEAESMKKVLDEITTNQEENVDEKTKIDLDGLDKSFYTSSFNITDKDFEDLSSLNSNIEKNNKLIRIAIFVFSTLIAIVLLILIAKVMF